MTVGVIDHIVLLPGIVLLNSGADPGFQVRGAHFKKLCRAEGGAKILGVFRVKKHDFMPKNHIFSNFRWGAPDVRPPPPGSAPEIYCRAMAFILL